MIDSSKLVLVHAKPQDAKAYVAIMREVESPINLVITQPAEAAMEIDSSVTYFIRPADSKENVGLISYTIPSVREAYISEVAIRRAYQGRGIGGEVLSRILQEMCGLGYRWVDLHTHPENGAQKLYERKGFRIIGRVENYRNSGTPRLHMGQFLIF